MPNRPLPLVLLALVFAMASNRLLKAADDNAPATVEIDFAEASGIAADKLKEVVAQAIQQTGQPRVPLTMILFDRRGVALAEREVTIQWKGGTEKIQIPQSGLIIFPIDAARLDGLKLIAPKEYTDLKQLSFPASPTYYQPKSDAGFTVPILNDSELKESLRRRLLQLEREKKTVNQQTLFEQLDRKHYTLELPAPPAKSLTPAEIYRDCRPSVVIMGTQARIGQFLIATGYIIDKSGIVVTNYHVMNHDGAEVTATGLMTADGRVFAVQEVLAADQVNDIAVIRVDAKDLPAVTLADDAVPGAPVTVIAHPAERMYYLTQGVVGRYSTWINRGHSMVAMSITAEFCPGSSGGPIFAANGAVAGMVASVNPLGQGMIDKQSIPARAIRALLESKP